MNEGVAGTKEVEDFGTSNGSRTRETESYVNQCHSISSRFACHSERSEESARHIMRILRCAQNDNQSGSIKFDKVLL